MVKRNFGVSMCGRIEYTRRKPRKAYCKNCIHCLLTEHGTEMYCKKYKRFKSIRQSKKAILFSSKIALYMSRGGPVMCTGGQRS